MLDNDIKKLGDMLKAYGAYEVLKELATLAQKESCLYASLGNFYAVIHKDSVTLADALSEMKNNHHLRK